MALGATRQVFHTNVDLTSSGVAERGGIFSYVPGVAGLGAYANAVAVSGGARPAGLLLDDVEALNFYNHPEYRQRNVVPQGSVVGLATEGEFETDFVETTGPGGIAVGTYAAGDLLYLADDGNLSRNNGTFAGTAIRFLIGRSLGTVDANGFLKFRLEL